VNDGLREVIDGLREVIDGFVQSIWSALLPIEPAFEIKLLCVRVEEQRPWHTRTGTPGAGRRIRILSAAEAGLRDGGA
jgi:hypothetical protein